ncbi:Ferric iron reductase FhuF-like transporter [Thermomonospora echinospora]|uniref:Ferric iron reductase FhuF-like transporter n=1 Tax=Thermomonospora echinospora TaxID=1992 RepID=A0A1H5VD61_9ACTN|nr:IucA/IucC family protein [Thermomonospora echinospora]SEF84731.1 Ferric iron reductase FhuF-like transporter [Thermomonospora echinospora]
MTGPARPAADSSTAGTAGTAGTAADRASGPRVADLPDHDALARRPPASAPGTGPDARVIESTLAARILDTLVREDYAGLRRFVAGHELGLPGGPAVRLLRARPDDLTGQHGERVPWPRPPQEPTAWPAGPLPGFLAEWCVDPAAGLGLADVFAVVRRVADPRDDVAAFERECRECLATLLLHEAARPQVLDRLRGDPATGPGTFYETLAAYTDHPVYPTGRCRVGLGEDDLRRYAPEFGPVFAMRWTAVPRERVTLAGERPAWWPRPADVGLPQSLAGTHELLPVHPLTGGHEVAPLPYLDVRPTLSMRTVAVDGHTHLKVPLPTSTLGLRNRRTIVPRTLHDGALAERILRQVLAREPRLPALLADEQTYGHAGDPLLGYLVRRFPERTANAHVVPVAALTAEHPGGGSVIERWDVASLFGDYLAALFAVNVTLFRYGIALEAHQQNVSLVLGDGPLRLLVKDNDGMLVHRRWLAAGIGPGFDAFEDRRMVTGDPEALAKVFVTITLHLCAGALAFGLAERGLLPLRTGLALVRERLDEALGSSPADRLLRSRTLDAGRLPAKAMLTAGTLVDKARTGARDINKHYGPDGPNYLDYFRD